MSITLITPTGERPEAFELCERWMWNQSLKWDQWIVVDDGEPRTETHLAQTVIDPGYRRSPDKITQRENLLAALERVTGDEVYIIEDDDYYAPEYLRSMHHAMRLGDLDVVGEAFSVYYHAPFRRWTRHPNVLSASLSQTGFKREMLPLFRRAVELSNEGVYIDELFWSLARKEGARCALKTPHASIGIKGLDGSPGITAAHKGVGLVDDPTGDKLRELIGKDAETYLFAYYPHLAASTIIMRLRNERRSGESYRTDDEKRIADILSGKRVAIVGANTPGAPSVEDFDLVVRINEHWKDASGRTDAIYSRRGGFPVIGPTAKFLAYDVNGPLRDHWRQGAAGAGVPLSFFDTNSYRLYNPFGPGLQWSSDLAAELVTMPLTGIVAVADLLRYSIRSLFVQGFTFYADINGTIPRRIHTHDLWSNASWLSERFKHDRRITLSPETESILAQNAESLDRYKKAARAAAFGNLSG